MTRRSDHHHGLNLDIAHGSLAIRSSGRSACPKGDGMLGEPKQTRLELIRRIARLLGGNGYEV